jgi:hypothetical protein
MKKINELNLKKSNEVNLTDCSKGQIIDWYHTHTSGSHIPNEILAPSHAAFKEWFNDVHTLATEILESVKQ